MLGLAGFSVATMMVATIQAKWWGTAADLRAVAPFCLTFGGIAQLLAGMWAYRARDVVATLAHGAWGAFWIAFFILQLLQANGTLPTPAAHAADLPFGMWFIGLAYIAWTAAFGAPAENLGVFAVLSTLAAGASLTAIERLRPRDPADRRLHARSEQAGRQADAPDRARVGRAGREAGPVDRRARPLPGASAGAPGSSFSIAARTS